MGFRPFEGSSPKGDFLRRFPNQDKRSEQQTSILQALYLMNGKMVDAPVVKSALRTLRTAWAQGLIDVVPDEGILRG